MIASMMQVQESQKEDLAAPEAAAYENQSGGVVAMLEKLLHEFEDELFALEKAEMKAQANYDMLAQKLTGLITDGNNGIASKTEDEKTLSDTKVECHSKADEYEKNQGTRADEIKAIEKAIEIMSSPAVSGNAEKHLPSLAQTSLIQVRTLDTGSGKEAAAAFLQKQAKSLG